MKIIQLGLAGMMICFCHACSIDVDFGEQYRKQIYIVKGNDRIVETTFPMTEKNDGFVTFYCSGSEMSGKDVVVRYKIDPEALQKFNETEYGDNPSKQMVCIPEEMITFHETSVIIPAGKEYAMLNFSINTTDLDPALNYALPITIVAVSDYEINENVKTLFYKVKLKTQYSGLYDAKVVYYSFGKVESTKYVQKKSVAVSKKQIKLSVLDKKEVTDGSVNYYIITLNDDNSVTLSTEDPVLVPQTQIYVNGSPVKVNYYDPEKRQFIIGYSYKTSANPNDWPKFIIETLDYSEE